MRWSARTTPSPFETAAPISAVAETYDLASRQRIGPFPDAGAHVALVNAAYALTRAQPAQDLRL
ncbi:MAG: hypothetical protein WCF20_08920 [Methylovirgula sp.]